MNEARSLRAVALSEETFDAFSTLHEGAGCAGCFCMYWHYTGDNRAWQLEEPSANREKKLALVRARKTHAIVLLDDARRDEHGRSIAVGAIQIEPRASLTKLTTRMPYRDLGPADGRWSVGCLLVRESERRKGIATQLVQAAIDWLRKDPTAVSLEAYPRLGDDLRDEEQWMGPESLFVRAGFHVVREHVQYPVLVLALRP
ncbi:MAG: GNAT family N-acetyltransferase [Myxococcales bacterium]|nr:GNAT family N-acetyltransferase [Myxococcales bacterium]